MARRTQDQWRESTKQHSESGKTAAVFCADHEINSKYFSLQKQKLSQEPEINSASFVASSHLQHQQPLSKLKGMSCVFVTQETGRPCDLPS